MYELKYDDETLKDMRVGKLTIIQECKPLYRRYKTNGRIHKRKYRRVLCLCDCGNLCIKELAAIFYCKCPSCGLCKKSNSNKTSKKRKKKKKKGGYVKLTYEEKKLRRIANIAEVAKKYKPNNPTGEYYLELFKQGYTLNEIAEKVGLSKQRVSRVIAGNGDRIKKCDMKK